MNYRALIRRLSDIEWPDGAILLLDNQDWRDLCEELAEDPELPIITVPAGLASETKDRGAEGRERTVIQVAETETYDRAAYRRCNEVINERIRPIGTRMDPYECGSCGTQFLFVSKKPRAAIVCDGCGGQAGRSTT